MKNRFGLDRAPSAEVKRAVRQRCGFGCVVCGLGWYDYEHFEPEFVDAREHRPEGMTLLCPNHNQARARNQLSRESVAMANADPFCRRRGYANQFFDLSPDTLTVRVGGASFTDCPDLILIGGYPILSVRPPEEVGAPFRLSGYFATSLGQPALRIRDNEWRAVPSTWDIRAEGSTITLNSAPGVICLRLVVTPRSDVVVDRLDMRLGHVKLQADADVLRMSIGDSGGWTTLQQVSMRRCRVGIFIDDGGPPASNDFFWD